MRDLLTCAGPCRCIGDLFPRPADVADRGRRAPRCGADRRRVRRRPPNRWRGDPLTGDLRGGGPESDGRQVGLASGTRAAWRGIARRDIAAAGNIYRYGYRAVMLDNVWRTVHERLADLVAACRAELDREPAP
ncbi:MULTISPECIES: hypothetical protein [Methylobacterium]|uniref:DUF86 domain-containing protein n=1 Tax=Methylobacterium longum TaxID=767694 RepID=A0ABT8AWC6_9HYPH|nr:MULTISPECIES: hypothetical protein [Methylobacterium]MCJ2098240.1 hypothetical protein [Methylobacterium sp. E-046]MDN3574232.1 hypothetical protein [Methylobacterium longum]